MIGSPFTGTTTEPVRPVKVSVSEFVPSLIVAEFPDSVQCISYRVSQSQSTDVRYWSVARMGGWAWLTAGASRSAAGTSARARRDRRGSICDSELEVGAARRITAEGRSVAR